MLIWVRETIIPARQRVTPITVYLHPILHFTADLANLFNTLTGYTRKPTFKKILVAPFNLHDEMIRLIKEEPVPLKREKMRAL